MTVLLAALPLPGCRDQPQQRAPAEGSAPPSFALPLAAGTAPAAPFAPTVETLPPASSPLTVTLVEGAERFRLIDQALAASDAFAGTPPDYVVRHHGSPVSVWRAANGGIRAVERLPGGERAYFYRALTEQPYLVAGAGAAFGYERGELASAYDGDGHPLDGGEASRRVIAAARLLDRGQALHRPITQARRQPAHAEDWRLAETAIEDQRLRWRQSLGRQPAWRDWHDDQAGDRARRWGAERQQRLAYASALRAAPAPPRPIEESAPALALAAAAATAAGAAKAAEPPAPAGRPGTVTSASAPVEPARSAASPAAGQRTATAHQGERPRQRAGPAKAKRKAAKNRKRLRRQPARRVAEQPARIEQPASREQPPETRKRKRPPKFLRDIGDFFDRTFGGDRHGVRVHRGRDPPNED